MPAGHDVTGLRFALRGSQHLPDAARWVVYAADAYEPGWTCFDRRLVCIPRWDYRWRAVWRRRCRPRRDA